MPGPSYTDSPLFRSDGTVACKGDALFLKTVTIEGILYCDTLAERTAGAGITADSVLLKDGDVYVALKVGHIDDANTFMQITPDRFAWTVGGIEMLTLIESLVVVPTAVVVNDSGDDVNFRVETENFTDAISCDAALDTVNLHGDPVTIGDGGATNYVEIGKAGNVVFKGGAGLQFGHMYVAADITVVIGDVNPTEVKNAAADGWTVGELNEVTFPGGGDEHYLIVPEVGRYKVEWSLSCHTAQAGGTAVHGGVMVANAAIRNAGEAHGTVSNTTSTIDLSGCTIVDIRSLAGVSPQISLWIADGNSANIVVEHGNMVVTQIGGT